MQRWAIWNTQELEIFVEARGYYADRFMESFKNKGEGKFAQTALKSVAETTWERGIMVEEFEFPGHPAQDLFTPCPQSVAGDPQGAPFDDAGASEVRGDWSDPRGPSTPQPTPSGSAATWARAVGPARRQVTVMDRALACRQDAGYSNRAPPPAGRQLSRVSSFDRITRALEAGYHAGRKLRGESARIPPTSPLAGFPEGHLYVVLKGRQWHRGVLWPPPPPGVPGVYQRWRSRPGAAEQVMEGGCICEESVCHRWGSLAEARAYCTGAGVELPPLQD